MRPRYTSNSGIFEKRGDPWVTRREGVKDFHRNLETEDPEYDFDHRFHNTGEVFGKPGIAKPKPKHRDPAPSYDKEAGDAARRKASIARRMNAAINEHTRTTTVVEAVNRPFRACAGCRLAACAAKGMCQNPFR